MEAGLAIVTFETCKAALNIQCHPGSDIIPLRYPVPLSRPGARPRPELGEPWAGRIHIRANEQAGSAPPTPPTWAHRFIPEIRVFVAHLHAARRLLSLNLRRRGYTHAAAERRERAAIIHRMERLDVRLYYYNHEASGRPSRRSTALA